MALIKEQDTNYGLSASYWKLGYVSIDRLTKYGSISFGLLFSPEAKESVASQTVFIDSPEDFEAYFGTEAASKYDNMYQAAYEYAKAKEGSFFADAENDGEYEAELLLR